MPYSTAPAATPAPPAGSSATSGTPRRSIPFGRPMIGDAERDAVTAVLSQPLLTHGPAVERFERSFAEFTGAPHAVAVNSCTAALHLAHLAVGTGPGDEVLVPAMTHVATAHAVELCGAKCVFVDAEARTGNIDLDAMDASITDDTKVISVTHYLGLPVDMPRVMEIADRYGCTVVEDCALAIGAFIDGTHVGLHGHAGCFSFYPIKHITTGEGGMFITRDETIAAEASCRRAFGIDRHIVANRSVPGEYDVPKLGNNYRMTEMAAAIGDVQMGRLSEFIALRRGHYEMLAAGLAEIDEIEVMQAGDKNAAPDGNQVRGHYCLSILLRPPLAPHRAAIMSRLSARGVGVSVYYPRPVPALTFYRERYRLADNAFPVAARISAQSIALPVGPHLDQEDIAWIIASVKDAVAHAKPS